MVSAEHRVVARAHSLQTKGVFCVGQSTENGAATPQECWYDGGAATGHTPSGRSRQQAAAAGSCSRQSQQQAAALP